MLPSEVGFCAFRSFFPFLSVLAGVKPFRPYVPPDSLVPAEKIRPWLLTKVINAERGAMFAPEFSQKVFFLL